MHDVFVRASREYHHYYNRFCLLTDKIAVEKLAFPITVVVVIIILILILILIIIRMLARISPPHSNHWRCTASVARAFAFS